MSGGQDRTPSLPNSQSRVPFSPPTAPGLIPQPPPGPPSLESLMAPVRDVRFQRTGDNAGMGFPQVDPRALRMTDQYIGEILRDPDEDPEMAQILNRYIPVARPVPSAGGAFPPRGPQLQQPAMEPQHFQQQAFAAPAVNVAQPVQQAQPIEPAQVSLAAQSAAARMAPAGNAQQQQQPGFVSRIASGVRDIASAVLAPGIVSIAGHAAYGAPGYVAGRVIESVGSKLLETPARTTNAMTSPIYNEPIHQIKPIGGPGLNININTGSIGYGQEYRNPLLHPYHAELYARPSYTHPYSRSRYSSTKDVDDIVEENEKEISKAQKKAEKKLEAAIKKEEKEEEKQTKAEWKRRSRVRANVYGATAKHLGLAVDAYLHGGRRELEEHAYDVGGAVFRKLGVI